MEEEGSDQLLQAWRRKGIGRWWQKKIGHMMMMLCVQGARKKRCYQFVLLFEAAMSSISYCFQTYCEYLLL